MCQLQKKRKHSIDVIQSVENLNLIAMGTAAGSILLYSLKKAELFTQMTNGHSDRVNAICWNVEDDSLFSCGGDHFIIHWSLTSSSVVQKWNSGKGEQFSISLCHTRRHLLTAGRVIQLWDLKTKEVLQAFHGHSTEVFSLMQVPNTRGSNCLPPNNTDVGHLSVDGSYVISAAVGDSKISVRQLSENSQERNHRDLVCSFSLPEDPIYVDICPPSEENQLFQLIAVTRSGKLVFFEHVLNGCQKKPLKPKSVVHFTTRRTKDHSPRSLDVVVAGFARERQRSIVFAYEDFTRPVFESLMPSELQSSFEREDPRRRICLEGSNTQMRQPVVAKDAKILGPGALVTSAPVRNRESKRRQSVEMSIEERLKAMGLANFDPKNRTRNVPKADNMAVLLEQGLTSEDKTILNNVLQKTDTAIIRNTVVRLKITAILPLLKELGKRISGHAQSAINDSVWLKHVIQTHHSYLISLPHIEIILGPLLNVLEVSNEKMQQSFLCKRKIDETLAVATAVRKFQDSNVTTEPAICEYEQANSYSED